MPFMHTAGMTHYIVGNLECNGGILCDFVVCFAVVKLLACIYGMISSRRRKCVESPIIKPTNYQNSDIFLRRRLITINWKLLANKARALHYMQLFHSAR